MLRLPFLKIGLGLVLLAGVSLEASPAKYPRRLVNGRLVDLKPLCNWWTNQAGIRPLSGWVHLTGTVTATNSWGWVVEGSAPARSHSGTDEEKSNDSRHQHRLLLLHPPLQDLASFHQLNAQLKVLNDQRSQFANEEGQIKSLQKTVSQEQSATHHNRARSSTLAQESKALSVQDKEAKVHLDALEKQIRTIKDALASYPSSERYVLDCFALDVGQEQNGVPVYDHGSVYQP